MIRSHTTAAALAITLAGVAAASPNSNVCNDEKFGWGENIGWVNFKDANAGAQGVRVYTDYLRGFAWAENVGWVNFGQGSGPYSNSTGADFGVNILPSGYCDGYAWGENIGWINFGTEPFVGADGARFDDNAGRFTGYAWAENVGWINLDDATNFVAVLIGDTNGDGLVNFGDLNAILVEFGASGSDLASDINGDGLVNFADLNAVLVLFGTSC